MKRMLDLKAGFMVMAAVAVLLFFSNSAQAQLTRGAIAGTVTDEQGAVVPGVEVKIVGVSSGATRDATTNDEGFYRVTALEPGVYSVTFAKSGFTKSEFREVRVQTSSETTIDGNLKVGDVGGTVDVAGTSEGIILNKTTPTIGATFTERQVEDLPLSAGRDVNQLALLAPNTFRAPGSTGISANGQRARNNNFTIDGSDNNDITVTLSTTPVFPEAVGEFQVQTNPYSVEFGRNSGAQINVITKSGTNDFHGDVFDYYRGSALNALDNIEKRSGLTTPARFNRNQTGFTIGGPIRLPHFGSGGPFFGYDGRDRSYFFFGFQSDIQRAAGALQASITIPTPAGFGLLPTVPLRAGQSAASRAAMLNGLSFLNGIYSRNPVFSNFIRNTAANCLNGTFVAATPTLPALCNGGRFIDYGVTSIGVDQPVDAQSYVVRVDHRITNDDNFTIRYISNKSNQPNVVSNLVFGSLYAGAQLLFDQNVAVSETHVFNSNVVNEVRGSYIRRNLDFPENDTQTLTTTIGGFFTFGGLSNFPQSRVTNYYQLSDTLSWQHGNHSFKFGVDMRYNQLINKSGFDLKGTYNFTNLASYLNNNAFSFGQAINPTNFDARQIQQFYFAQDDWRITPNLTLNLGLRYETAGVPFGFFGDPDPAHQAFLIPGPVQRDNNNFAPALGFAWSPRPEGGFMRSLMGDGKTVLRGGYRIAYDLLFYNILVVNAGNFPYTINFLVNNVLDQFPARAPAVPVTFNPLTAFVNTQEDARTPYSQLYSFSVQREFARSYVVEFGYTGSRSLDQVRQIIANPSILTAAQAATVRAGGAIPGIQARRLVPTAGARTIVGPGAQATYNAAFVTLNKRLSRGLQFGIAYTYSKLTSNNDESLGVAAITNSSPQIAQNGFDIPAERSLSVFDRTHRFVANYIYDVPMPGFARNNGFARQIFGGWQISGVTTRQSGQPFTIFTGVDTNGNGTATADRPNFNSAGDLFFDPVTGNLRSFTFNPANPMFLVPRAGGPGGTLIFTGTGAIVANSLGDGTLPRNSFRGPGYYNTNLSVAKNFTMGESRRLQLRSDFLNAFNQDDYGNPTSNMNSANFGRNLNNWGNRSITLGVKFSF